MRGVYNLPIKECLSYILKDMKAYNKLAAFIKHFEQKHANATLFIGIAIGIGVGMYVFASFVPGYTSLMRMHQDLRYEHMDGRSGMMIMKTSGMPMMTTSMNITNEKQFLVEMIAHHEAAVRMSHQVLSLVGISTDVKTLAEGIIENQNAEIDMMKEWLAGKGTAK